MSKTKHLDTAISIFRADSKHKRAARKAQVEITVMLDDGGYMLQLNGKLIEEGVGDEAFARKRAECRADIIRNLGKSCIVTVF